MMQKDDSKRLFLNMQEHPENYSDEQLEAMMADIDRKADAAEAWTRFSEKARMKDEKTTFSVRKMVATFAGIVCMTGIAIASLHYYNKRGKIEQMGHDSLFTSDVSHPSAVPVHFENVSLDSILTVVSAHYGKAVAFRDEAPRHSKLIMTWKPDAPLADFLDRLDAFDELSLFMQNDTIIVENEEKEGEQ